MKICPKLTQGALSSKEGWDYIQMSGKDGLDCIGDKCVYWITYDDIHRTDVTGRCAIPDFAILLSNMINGKKRKNK